MSKLIIQQAYANGKHSADELAEYLVENGVDDSKETYRIAIEREEF